MALKVLMLRKRITDANAALEELRGKASEFERREADIAVDYKAFDIANEFVVGYGLDYDQKYRNLPEIGVLKREIYEK